MQSASGANQLSAGSQITNDLQNPVNAIAGRPSVTEHTTHHLNPNKS
jgi:hypothetical protein